MFRQLTLPALLAVFTPMTIISQQLPSTPLMAQNTVKCNPAGNNVEMKKCADDQYQAADKKLNQAYQKLMSQIGPQAGKQRLIVAQRAWINFRDKNCSYESGKALGGSLEGLLYANCLTEMTNKRTQELNNYAHNQQALDQSKKSPSPSPQNLLKVATVKNLVMGDLMCYATLLDEKNKEVQQGAVFGICETPDRYINQKVRLTYGQVKVNDCQSSEPCGKTKVETLITKMDIIN